MNCFVMATVEQKISPEHQECEINTKTVLKRTQKVISNYFLLFHSQESQVTFLTIIFCLQKCQLVRHIQLSHP